MHCYEFLLLILDKVSTIQFTNHSDVTQLDLVGNSEILKGQEYFYLIQMHWANFYI